MGERAVIYHNPRCSKSRATLKLLEERGIEPEVVLYLEAPPSPERVLELARLLGSSPHGLLRCSEPPYRELGLGPDTPPLEIARAVRAHPILLERPIVVLGDRAVLGRPPENVLTLL
jgi:arsenate reductase (glutaredoxin)